MHAETLTTTLQLSQVEELPSAQQRIYVLSVTRMSITDAVASKRKENLDDINNFQTSKSLSFPITIHHANNDNDEQVLPPMILNRFKNALHTGNNKLILRKWKQGARWWNLNMNHTDTSSSTDATINNNGQKSNTLSMAKAEVAGYRLAKLAMNHSLQHGNMKRKICAYIPDVLYFSHDENDTVDTEGDPWALFSYFGDCTEGLNNGGGGENCIDIVDNSNLKWDSKAIASEISQQSSEHHNHFVECKHYPTTMTKVRHEFGFDEPHPRHGRVPIDESSDYAHMILRDVVLPIHFAFFEWSSSPVSPIQSSGSNAEWKRNICALAADSQTAKPFQYHDMIAVYKLALQRLSKQNARVDERMETLLHMMSKCIDALEHEWDDHDGRRPSPLPAVICHMDLQPQNLTFRHDRNGNENGNANRHVAQHCNVAYVVDFEEAAYADPRFEVLLICRKVLANLEQAEELWKSYSSSVKLQTAWDVGPIEPWLRLETVHSLFTLLLQANDLLGGGRNPWETKPDLEGKIDRERKRLVRMGWTFCMVDVKCLFEQYAKYRFKRSQAKIDMNKLLELMFGDDHTLASFYRKRIPCSCMDEKFKEAKSMKKKGLCWNTGCCMKAEERIDRSSLLCCARCRGVYYCSAECQKINWPIHKEECEHAVAVEAEFYAKHCAPCAGDEDEFDDENLSVLRFLTNADEH